MAGVDWINPAPLRNQINPLHTCVKFRAVEIYGISWLDEKL